MHTASLTAADPAGPPERAGPAGATCPVGSRDPNDPSGPRDSTDAVAPPLDPSPADRARRGTAAELRQALQATRADTLAQFDAWRAALPALSVPQRAGLNPPLWELGHLGWFQEYWLARNPERARGDRADPDAPRRAPQRPGADALYDSGRVAHASRWTLPLPDAAATRDDLAMQLDATLALLDAGAEDDDMLYFHRLALHHEDMHHEASLWMAQALALPPADDRRWAPPRLPAPPPALALPAGAFRLGSVDDAGFAFDNERGAVVCVLAATAIDAQVLRWAEYLPDVEAGLAPVPACLRRRQGRGWERRRGDRWLSLDDGEPACHLALAEATAWCRRAGRRLPTELEWEAAAVQLGTAFRWGDVWEWTASAFAPYPGFRAHPYRDYSLPWFDGRPVLRGGSFMTQPRMKHARYRNFFEAHRRDIAAGFRTCRP